MDFSLSEEQKMFKDMARKFFAKECNKSVIRELAESQTGHSPVLWKNMAELAWPGIMVPEEYDGAGLSLMEAAILFEEIGRAAFDSPLLANLMGTQIILEGGTEEQKQSFLPKIISGDLIVTMAVEELAVSYDHKNISLSTTLTRNGFSLNGSKYFVPYANISDYILVAARTDSIPGDEDGISLFLIDKNTSGLSYSELDTVAPDRQFQVDINDVHVSHADIVGKLNKGLYLLRSIYEKGTVLACVEMLGGAEYQLHATSEYTKTRVQFDRPIGTFQAVQHQLADMFTDVQGSRWTTYQAASRLSKGLPSTKEVAIAKSFTSNACQRAGATAHQLHGGMGVDLDNDLHFYFERAKALELKFGPSEIHLNILEEHLGL